MRVASQALSLLIRSHDQPPERGRVEMVPALWEGLAHRRRDLVTAFNASVNPGAIDKRIGAEEAVKCVVIILDQMREVFVGSHDCVLSIGKFVGIFRWVAHTSARAQKIGLVVYTALCRMYRHANLICVRGSI